MIVSGFQKLTLLDFPGKVACTVFTGGCNLRCPFCHNSALVTKLDPSSYYDTEDVLGYIRSRKGLLDGVAITGGEPLLQSDIDVFIAKIKDMGFKVKLDTNGTFPDKLIEFVNAELVDYVAMDVKNREEKYAETVGVKNFDLTPINKSMDFLLEGKVPYEFRTTVVKQFHTVNDIEALAKRISGAENYFLQNFTDSGALIGENLNLSAADKETMFLMKEAAKKHVKHVELRGV